MIPPVFVITCPELERYAASQAYFASCGVPVRFWRGVHGKTWGLRTSIFHRPTQRISPGNVGLNLSCWNLWQALTLLDGDEFLLLDDDAVFCDNFREEYAKTRQELPDDWQIAFVGWLDAGAERRLVSPRILWVERTFGLHAYLVRKAALPTLLDTMAIAHTNVDLQLHDRALPHLKHYCFDPPLIRQRSCDGEWTCSTR